MGSGALTQEIRVSACAAVLVALIPEEASSQAAWRPDKAVELVVSTAPGGNNDAMARLLQKVLQERNLRSRDFAKFLQGEYNITTALMADVGLAK